MMEKTDHDLLIKIDTKLTTLCRQFREVKKENTAAHEKIWGHLERYEDKNLQETKQLNEKMDEKFLRKGAFWKTISAINVPIIGGILYKIFGN